MEQGGQVLADYIAAIEKALGKKAKRELLLLQAEDVFNTFANADDLVEQFGYRPSTSVEDGITQYVSWFRDYFKV